MNIIVIGSGMMGSAIVYDLIKFSNFENIAILDKNIDNLTYAKNFLVDEDIEFFQLDIKKTSQLRDIFDKYDVAISAVPYKYNFNLSKIAVETNTNFLDLGGNNDIVKKQRSLNKKAKKNDIVIIPDCGLAPGLTSVITKDAVETLKELKNLKIRVGGLPLEPKPPLNYQIVFSPYGLVNEYVEDSIVLDNGKVITKPSMTELEEITFPKPFGNMEAFLTSGGCSTLPYTYKKKIGYLDYKTIRYKGHCENFKQILKIKPREKMIEYLKNNLPKNEKDVVLLKVSAEGNKNNSDKKLVYQMIDYFDNEKNITSMMRTTAYPTSIIAILIEKNFIDKKGVFCPEEAVPCKPFFEEISKRNIKIKKTVI